MDLRFALRFRVYAGDQRTMKEIARTKSFRLQNREFLERIPLTAEVTVCVPGGPVL